MIKAKLETTAKKLWELEKRNHSFCDMLEQVAKDFNRQGHTPKENELALMIIGKEYVSVLVDTMESLKKYV